MQTATAEATMRGMPTANPEFASRIKLAAEARGMSLRDIAEQIGIEPQRMYEMASRKSIPRADVADSICRAVDVPLPWACGQGDDEVPASRFALIDDYEMMHEIGRRYIALATEVMEAIELFSKTNWQKAALDMFREKSTAATKAASTVHMILRGLGVKSPFVQMQLFDLDHFLRMHADKYGVDADEIKSLRPNHLRERLSDATLGNPVSAWVTVYNRMTRSHREFGEDYDTITAAIRKKAVELIKQGKMPPSDMLSPSFWEELLKY